MDSRSGCYSKAGGRRDANGVVADIQYDQRGRLTASFVRGLNDSSEADDRAVHLEYWPGGEVKKITLGDGSFTSYTYDAAHRLTGIADAAGNTITYTLDSAGHRTNEEVRDASNALVRTLSTTYNTVGRLQSITDAYSHTASLTYDASGNPDLATDGLSRVEDQNYDPLERITRSLRDVSGVAAETKYAYSLFDDVTKVTDPKGLNTNYTYNGFGDLTQVVSPDTGTANYTYDSAGNLATKMDARGVTATYGYDALNRMTSISYPTSSLDVAYTYDTAQAACQSGETFTAGHLAKIVDGSGSTIYCYNRFGDLVRKIQTTNGNAFVLQYAWNAAGQLLSTTYPDGAVIDYVYDTIGRVTEVGAAPTSGARQVLLKNLSYHPFGPASTWQYGNDRTLSRTLNLNYQPGVVQDEDAGGLSVGYEFDAVGNLKRLRDGDQSEPPQREYGYDGLNRLAQTKDGSTAAVLQAYGYDKTGNRTSATVSGTTTTYTYPTDKHRLSQVGTNARTYDANGNTTQIAGTPTRDFVYGDHNRMTQASQGGSVTSNYAYNGAGEQVRRFLGSANTYAVYDEAGHWIGDYGNGGATAPAQQAIWFAGMPVGVFVGAGTSQKLYYIEPDALGTPRVVIDPTRGTTGTTVWKWDLAGEAFGTMAPNQDPDGDSTQFVFNLRFPGQRYDAASGLNYNYFRDYEAATGRYVESDPIGLRGGISTYSYADGVPVLNVDENGMEFAFSPGFDSVAFTCIRNPSFCSDLLGDIAEGQSGVQRRLGNYCAAEYYDALDGLSHASKPLIENASLVHDLARAALKLPYVAAASMKPGKGPRFYDLKDHVRRHGNGLSDRAYYAAAVSHTATADARFLVYHDGQFKYNYVSRTGPDSFVLTSTNLSGNRIFTHINDPTVNTRYLGNLGITLPEGF